jgi:hypothetical protein
MSVWVPHWPFFNKCGHAAALESQTD